jgi:hypothetical protein
MKQLLTMILLMISIISYSQQKIDLHLPKYISTKKYKPRYGVQVTPAIGFGMMLGGAAIATAGLCTGSVTEENKYGEIVPKPFYKQGAKALAIASGGALFVGGIIIAL